MFYWKFCDVKSKSCSVTNIDKCIKKIIGDLTKKISELTNIINDIIDKISVFTDSLFILKSLFGFDCAFEIEDKENGDENSEKKKKKKIVE